ncbi:hypothetical protein SL053_002591, partial [Flavobacterium psychrophilum]|nr:hypothetical protein [Flavobacterium psychrophilum]
MNLKQNILNNDKQTAPDCSGSPEVMKVIFSRHSKATAGSSCNGFRKKTLRTRAIAQSWNRLKKNKGIVKVHCTEHEYGMVNVTLWEDDAVGKG